MFESQYLKRQNELLTAQLAEALRASQAQNERLIATLEHVVTAQFDKPLMPQPQEQPKREPMPDLGYVLSVEDDTEFLEKTDQ